MPKCQMHALLISEGCPVTRSPLQSLCESEMGQSSGCTEAWPGVGAQAEPPPEDWHLLCLRTRTGDRPKQSRGPLGSSPLPPAPALPRHHQAWSRSIPACSVPVAAREAVPRAGLLRRTSRGSSDPWGHFGGNEVASPPALLWWPPRTLVLSRHGHSLLLPSEFHPVV